MKVLIFMLILGAIAIYAVPVENESEDGDQNLEVFDDTDIADIDFPNELNRDKRQYGKLIFRLQLIE